MAPPSPGAASAATSVSATSMVTLISCTVWVSVIDRASARGAAAKTSSEISCVAAATTPPERSHSTSERTPAWATSMTQDR